MNLAYVPLLPIQREVQGLPRNYERFQQYLRTIMNADCTDIELVPMLAMNPMGKEHVTEFLDQLLAFDADRLAEQTARDAADKYPDLAGGFKASVVAVDDLKGGWTNRWTYELSMRRPAPGAKRFWIAGYLWTSEVPSAETVRATIAAAVHRTAFALQHGTAQTLRDLLNQEGFALARAGFTTPVLEADDLDYTREVLEPHLNAADMPTCIACLFGDAAGQTLGFKPLGLGPWAGVALALHDAQC
jgi:hypothetical protein